MKKFCIAFLFLSNLLFYSEAKDRDVYCAACRALVDEVEHAVSKVDPKKKIEVGSYRVDGQGNQRGLKQIPYARSEIHLTEVLESVCDRKLGDYARAQLPDGTPVFVRTVSRGSEIPNFSTVELDWDVKKSLQFACDTLLSDHEDDLMPVFRKGGDGLEARICVDIMGECSPTQLESYTLGTISAETAHLYKQKPVVEKPEEQESEEKAEKSDKEDEDNEEETEGDEPAREEL